MKFKMLLEFPGILILVGFVLLIVAVLVGVFAYKKKSNEEIVEDDNDYETELIKLDDKKIKQEEVKEENKNIVEEEVKVPKEETVEEVKEPEQVKINEEVKEVEVVEEPFSEPEENFLEDEKKDYVPLKDDLVTTLLEDEEKHENVETL